MTSSFTPRETWRSDSRGMSKIESELVKLEHALALAQAEGETNLPARTNVLNLVVYVKDEAELQQACDAVMHLGGRHPSRTIYVIPGASVSGEVEAELRAHCLAGTESVPQICVEEIRLRTGAFRSGNLPELLSPLLIADLPTFAWCPVLTSDSGSVLAALAELADHVVVDSSASRNTGDILRTLAPFGRQLTDVAWLRLLPWCELTAQFFDPEASRRYLDQLTMLQIEYAAPTMTNAVLYAGWLSARL
ncbi:MAG: glucose-6-phosphate dehydrogenase assembly protein OpcA, partial [Chloroflexota bacterium]